MCHLCTSGDSSTAHRKVCVGEAQLRHVQTRKSEGTNRLAKGVAKVQAKQGYKAEDLLARGPAKKAKRSHTPQRAYSDESSSESSSESSEDTDMERRRREKMDRSKSRPGAKKRKAAKARAAESSSGEVHTHRSSYRRSQGQDRESSGSRTHWQPSNSKPQASSGYQGKNPDPRYYIHNNPHSRPQQRQNKRPQAARPQGPPWQQSAGRYGPPAAATPRPAAPPAMVRGKGCNCVSGCLNCVPELSERNSKK